jgi:hypothetical protein
MMIAGKTIPSLNIVAFGALILWSLGSTLASAADGDAPLTPTITPGLRVRILAPEVSSKKLVGTVDRVSDDSVILDVPGRTEPVVVSREKIVRLDVSDGARSRGTDAAIGAGVGALMGAASGALANGSSGGGHIVSSGAVAGFCALIGAGVGALIGVAIPPGEHWREISTSHYRVGFTPRLDHGLDLAVAWNF